MDKKGFIALGPEAKLKKESWRNLTHLVGKLDRFKVTRNNAFSYEMVQLRKRVVYVLHLVKGKPDASLEMKKNILKLLG
jgi:hypothetical protein